MVLGNGCLEGLFHVPIRRSTESGGAHGGGTGKPTLQINLRGQHKGARSRRTIRPPTHHFSQRSGRARPAQRPALLCPARPMSAGSGGHNRQTDRGPSRSLAAHPVTVAVEVAPIAGVACAYRSGPGGARICAVPEAGALFVCPVAAQERRCSAPFLRVISRGRRRRGRA